MGACQAWVDKVPRTQRIFTAAERGCLQSARGAGGTGAAFRQALVRKVQTPRDSPFPIRLASQAVRHIRATNNCFAGMAHEPTRSGIPPAA